jgi:hypothetical protein
VQRGVYDTKLQFVYAIPFISALILLLVHQIHFSADHHITIREFFYLICTESFSTTHLRGLPRFFASFFFEV